MNQQEFALLVRKIIRDATIEEAMLQLRGQESGGAAASHDAEIIGMVRNSTG